ncbi:MAG: hypothetical protein ACQERS_08685 [Bacteroidota bacterium]
MKYRLTYYMFQIPASEIADEEYRQGRILADRLAREYKKQDTDMLALAIWEIMPLVFEHRAISRFVRETNSLDLYYTLPEILSADEALLYLEGDRPYLSEKNKEIIKFVLTNLEKNLPSVASSTDR